MARLVKLKSVNIHPDYHKKLIRLSDDCYRGLCKQLEYLIDKEYIAHYGHESDNLIRLNKETE